MSYKVKNLDVQNLIRNKVSIFSERKLDVKTIFWLSKLQKELTKIFDLYEEQRIKLNQDYCARDEKGKPLMKEGIFQFSDEEKKKELYVKVSELGDIEVEIPFDRLRIPLSKLEGIITATDFTLLEPFIEFAELS